MNYNNNNAHNNYEGKQTLSERNENIHNISREV